jgi:hypothetical protein
MGDSDVDSLVTGMPGDGGTRCLQIGDFGSAQETVDVRDMGDTEVAGSADALENDLSHG